MCLSRGSDSTTMAAAVLEQACASPLSTHSSSGFLYCTIPPSPANTAQPHWQWHVLPNERRNCPLHESLWLLRDSSILPLKMTWHRDQQNFCSAFAGFGWMSHWMQWGCWGMKQSQQNSFVQKPCSSCSYGLPLNFELDICFKGA